ncbi:MAG TPA: DUF885 domain-containing protein [Bryobacteraceae bacterium]|nr:DUF885 domain-containing protein [Bryobacteraceae bacterium]
MTKAFATALLLAASLPGQTPNIDDFFRDFTATWVRGNPNLATSSRYFSGEEQDRLERQLTPQTVAYRRARIQLAKQGLAQLQKFDRSKLTPTQRISADLMQWQLDTVVREEPYLDYTFPLEQMNGANVNLIETLTVRHPLANEKDAENYVVALRQVSTRMEEATAEARALAAKNIIPPKFILNATIKQMQGFVDPSPGQNPFVAIFAQKMEAAKIPEPRREALRSEAEKIVSVEVYPVWKNAISTLQSQLPRSTDDAGLWRLKGGASAYPYFLRRYTTTNLTPEQIHQVGLNEVARIEKEMDTIFRRLGRTEGSINQRSEKLKQDMAYPLTEEGRATIMADADGILRDAEKRAAVLFDKTPKSRVVVQPFPRFREANAAANYNSPAPDGSRPGVIQIPLRPEMMTKFALRSLIYHEGVPGHHFQIALEAEDKALPRFRQVRAFGNISALSEGWGLYAERLAAESGWYEGDPQGQLGQLYDALWRARRLVVDTGLHAKHWTRQQAIDYGIEASEVERYVVFPGQACSYMIGQLKIVELRERARKALGDKFSLREYHDVVLDTGTVPLEILERQVDAYIASARNRNP